MRTELKKLSKLNSRLIWSMERQQRYFSAGREAPFIFDLVQMRIFILKWWYKRKL